MPGFCTTYGIRTRDSSVKGRRLNPLTNAACCFWECKDKVMYLFSQTIFKLFLESFFNYKKRTNLPMLTINSDYVLKLTGFNS